MTLVVASVIKGCICLRIRATELALKVQFPILFTLIELCAKPALQRGVFGAANRDPTHHAAYGRFMLRYTVA